MIDGVADARLRVLLYHIPQVSGVGLSHAVIAALLRLYPQTIVGIKDSGCETAHALALADAFMPALGVHVGYEPDLPALARRGSAGAVNGLSNFMPRLVQRLIAAPDAPGTEHDLARVRQLLTVLGSYALTPALKGIMATVSGAAGWLRVRPPLVALADGERQRLEREMRAFALDPDHD